MHVPVTPSMMVVGCKPRIELKMVPCAEKTVSTKLVRLKILCSNENAFSVPAIVLYSFRNIEIEGTGWAVMGWF